VTHAAALERLTRPEGPLLETLAKQCSDAQLAVELVVAPGGTPHLPRTSDSPSPSP
jgi:hypothetical protein